MKITFTKPEGEEGKKVKMAPATAGGVPLTNPLLTETLAAKREGDVERESKTADYSGQPGGVQVTSGQKPWEHMGDKEMEVQDKWKKLLGKPGTYTTFMYGGKPTTAYWNPSTKSIEFTVGSGTGLSYPGSRQGENVPYEEVPWQSIVSAQ